jgi:hypothetical protein
VVERVMHHNCPTDVAKIRLLQPLTDLRKASRRGKIARLGKDGATISALGRRLKDKMRYQE